VHRTIARVLKPFSLETGADCGNDARILHRRLIDADFAVIDYGTAVTVDAGQMQDFYLVQMPLVGSYTLCVDGTRTLVNRGDAHLVHPRVPLRMEWSENCRLLVVRTSDSRLAAIERRQRRGDRRSALGYLLSNASSRGASLRRAMEYVCSEVSQGALFTARREFPAIAESLLLGALLEAAADMSGSDLEPIASCLQRADCFIRANLGNELSVADIVAASGTSRRSLYHSFQQAYGEGPMARVRRLRLARVNSELVDAAAEHCRISDVAARWGFTHFGHFCAAYRGAFGETPTETCRRHRAAQ